MESNVRIEKCFLLPSVANDEKKIYYYYSMLLNILKEKKKLWEKMMIRTEWQYDHSMRICDTTFVDIRRGICAPTISLLLIKNFFHHFRFRFRYGCAPVWVCLCVCAFSPSVPFRSSKAAPSLCHLYQYHHHYYYFFSLLL